VQVAVELFAAIALADLPKLESVILAYAMASLYGPAKLQGVETVLIEPTDLASVTFADFRNYRKAIKHLTDWNILIEASPRHYRINKDYETWTRDGKPMVGARANDARFIPWLTSRCGMNDHTKRKQSSGSTQTPASTSVGVYLDPQTTVKRGLSGPPNNCKRGSIQTPTASDASDASVDTKDVTDDGTAFALKNIKNTRILNTSSLSLAAHAREGTRGDDDEPFIPPTHHSEAQSNLNPTEADRAGEWAMAKAREAYPGDDSIAEILCIRASSWVRDEGFTVVDVQAGILKAIGKGVHAGGIVNYARKAMNSLATPDRGPAASAVESAPAPLSKRDRLLATFKARKTGEANP
jgi:hypothetical protein